jgi:transcriptional regulator with XRE-family HTH domain
MTVNERIAFFYEKHLKMTALAFARSLGMSKQAVSGLTNNVGSAPSFKFVETIAKTFPELNIRWLLTGEGAMLGDAGGIASAIHTPQRVEHEKIALLEQLLEEKERTIKTQAALINALGG